MSFFEPPATPPDPPEEQRQPPWIGPPENELGAALPDRVPLARTADTAVAVLQLVAYSTGFGFLLGVRRRLLADDDLDPFMHRLGRRAGDHALRLGVGFADGRKATNLSLPLHHDEEGPVLIFRGGGGGGRTWDMGFWVWPLPPPGPLAFVCKWPAAGIAETRVEIEARSVLDASARSQLLWPEGGAPSGSGWTSSSL